jgi:hypothetical protein
MAPPRSVSVTLRCSFSRTKDLADSRGTGRADWADTGKVVAGFGTKAGATGATAADGAGVAPGGGVAGLVRKKRAKAPTMQAIPRKKFLRSMEREWFGLGKPPPRCKAQGVRSPLQGSFLT